MSKTQKNLNKILADFQVLNAKLHHFHWYVKGEQFFRLHEKFEELFEEVQGLIDEVAERNLQIGGKPFSSMTQYLENTSLKEETRELNSEKMVRCLINDYNQLVDSLKKFSDIAAEEQDKATEDMMIGVTASFEKTLWMLNAYLA